MLRAYAQLLRIPNVFTAMADICLGALLVIHWEHERLLWSVMHSYWFLLGASACLYCAGMALNDFFDAEQDRLERPFRPIPSGRVSRFAAGLLGASLLLLGIALAAISSFWIEQPHPLIIACFLATSILLYDALFSGTAVAPLGMAACRYLNVLLGLSGYDSPTFAYEHHLDQAILGLPLVVGIYIMGVTLFARTEATRSKRNNLLAAAGLITLSFVLAELYPTLSWAGEKTDMPRFAWWYPYLTFAWGVAVGVPVLHAIRRPEPRNVQKAVKVCILGLIGLDAVLAFGIVGWPGLWILVLLAPAILLGRWVYST